jgi:hypothetical protein
MNNPLKQANSVTVKLGPFIDDMGTTLTDLSIAQAYIQLSKNGGAFTPSHNTAGAAHDVSGYYTVPLDATDTNTLGLLRVMIDMSASGALPVYRDLVVLASSVYDALVAATASLSTTAGTVTDKTGYSLTSAYDAAQTAAQPADIPTVAQVADAVLSRNVAQAEAASPRTSLATAILAMTNKANTIDNDGFLTVYRTDGVTEHARIPVSTDENAEPIDGVG